MTLSAMARTDLLIIKICHNRPCSIVHQPYSLGSSKLTSTLNHGMSSHNVKQDSKPVHLLDFWFCRADLYGSVFIRFGFGRFGFHRFGFHRFGFHRIPSVRFGLPASVHVPFMFGSQTSLVLLIMVWRRLTLWIPYIRAQFGARHKSIASSSM